MYIICSLFYSIYIDMKMMYILRIISISCETYHLPRFRQKSQLINSCTKSETTVLEIERRRESWLG